jgi:hypothetical protein
MNSASLQRGQDSRRDAAADEDAGRRDHAQAHVSRLGAVRARRTAPASRRMPRASASAAPRDAARQLGASHVPDAFARPADVSFGAPERISRAVARRLEASCVKRYTLTRPGPTRMCSALTRPSTSVRARHHLQLARRARGEVRMPAFRLPGTSAVDVEQHAFAEPVPAA